MPRPFYTFDGVGFPGTDFLQRDHLRSLQIKQEAAILRIRNPDYLRLKAEFAEVSIPSQVREQAKLKADTVLKNSRQKAAIRRSPTQQAKLKSQVRQIKAELADAKQLLAIRSFRTPDQIIATTLSRSKMAATINSSRTTVGISRRLRNKIPGKLIIYTKPTTFSQFEKSITKALKVPANQKLSEYGIEVDTFYKSFSTDQLFVVKFGFSYISARKDLWNLASILRKTPGFISVQPERVNSVLFSSTILDDDLSISRNVRWHLEDIKLLKALEISPRILRGKQQGEGVIIGHPDTGWREHGQYVRPNEQHVDFARSHNVITGKTGGKHAEHGIPPSYNPNITHGTATACLIVSRENATTQLATKVNNKDPRPRSVATNPVDILGVAPKSRVLPIKCVDDVMGVARIADEHLAKAIEYAVIQDVDVISISLGGAMHPAVEEAIRRAIKKNIIVIAAAGQTFFRIINTLSPNDSVIEPASFPDVIAVAGSTKNRRPWNESHSGPSVDITAPGHGIWVADFAEKDGTEIVLAGSGTSFSAAITAGVAALWIAYWGKQHLLETYKNVPLARVFRYLLRHTADNIGGQWDTKHYGAGIINAEALLKEPLPAENVILGADINKGNLIGSIGDGIEVLHDTWDMLEDLAQDSVELAEDLSRLVGYQIKAAGDAIVEAARNEYERMVSIVSVTTGQLQEKAKKAARDAEEALNEATEAAEEAIDEAIEMIEDTAETITEVVETVADVAGETAEDVIDWFNSLW